MVKTDMCFSATSYHLEPRSIWASLLSRVCVGVVGVVGCVEADVSDFLFKKNFFSWGIAN